MKKLYIFILFIFSILHSYSQSQNDYSYSAGIRVFSYGEYPKLLNEARNSDSYRSAAFNGLVFKFNDNQISYRVLGTVYSNNEYSFKNTCNNCETVKGKFEDFTAKIGFERNIIYGPVQPFYGIDLGFKKISFSGDSKDVTTGTPLYDVDVEKNGGIIYPFIGVKINLLKAMLTLSAEAGLDALYSYDKETKTINGTASISNFKRWGFYNQPLGMLSLQFNFGTQ